MWLCYTTTVVECLLFSLWELVSLHDPDQSSQETVAVIVGYLKVFAYEWMQALMHFRVPRCGSNIVCGVHCKKWLSDFQMLLINVFTDSLLSHTLAFTAVFNLDPRGRCLVGVSEDQEPEGYTNHRNRFEVLFKNTSLILEQWTTGKLSREKLPLLKICHTLKSKGELWCSCFKLVVLEAYLHSCQVKIRRK